MAYRLLLPDGLSSPAEILRLPLPPTVILGCCWSARSSEQPGTFATAVSCLVAGASRSVAGRVICGAYENWFANPGLSPAEALPATHRALPAAHRRPASGVAVIGGADARHSR